MIRRLRLDRYFKSQVSQDIKRRVAGFHTSSATNLALTELPEARAKLLPRYPVVPAVLMGRLAVATKAQGHKLGTAMLAHATEAVATSDIGAFGVVVDAKDAVAQRFYERHGFVVIKDRRMVLPLESALKVLGITTR